MLEGMVASPGFPLLEAHVPLIFRSRSKTSHLDGPSSSSDRDYFESSSGRFVSYQVSGQQAMTYGAARQRDRSHHARAGGREPTLQPVAECVYTKQKLQNRNREVRSGIIGSLYHHIEGMIYDLNHVLYLACDAIFLHHALNPRHIERRPIPVSFTEFHHQIRAAWAKCTSTVENQKQSSHQNRRGFGLVVSEHRQHPMM